MPDSPDTPKSFWVTLPGILTGLASLIGAVTTLVLIFYHPKTSALSATTKNAPITGKTPDSAKARTPVDTALIKIIRDWHYKLVSAGNSQHSLRGILTISKIDVNGEFTGEMEDPANNGAFVDITGSFKDNKLNFTRPMADGRLTQVYAVTYESKDKMKGFYLNNTLNNDLKNADQGTFDLSSLGFPPDPVPLPAATNTFTISPATIKYMSQIKVKPNTSTLEHNLYKIKKPIQ